MSKFLGKAVEVYSIHDATATAGCTGNFRSMGGYAAERIYLLIGRWDKQRCPMVLRLGFQAVAPLSGARGWFRSFSWGADSLQFRISHCALSGFWEGATRRE
jgi:hypothetical protein